MGSKLSIIFHFYFLLANQLKPPTNIWMERSCAKYFHPYFKNEREKLAVRRSVLLLKMAKNVLLNSPGPAQRHKNMSSPLALFIGDIISIIPEIFENLKILTPKNAFAPVWNPGLGPIQAQRHFSG